MRNKTFDFYILHFTFYISRVLARSKIALLSALIILITFFKSYAQEAISVFGRVYADPQNGPGYFEPLSNVLNSFQDCA